MEPLLDLNQVTFHISFLVAHTQMYQDLVPTSAETRVQWIFSLVGWWFGSIVLAFSPKYLHSTFPSFTISINSTLTTHIYFILLTLHSYFTVLIFVCSYFWGLIFVVANFEARFLSLADGETRLSLWNAVAVKRRCSETPLQWNAVAVKRRWGSSGPGRFAPHCFAVLTARTYLK